MSSGVLVFKLMVEVVVVESLLGSQSVQLLLWLRHGGISGNQWKENVCRWKSLPEDW
jgi:hypothetical protein